MAHSFLSSYGQGGTVCKRHPYQEPPHSWRSPTHLAVEFVGFRVHCMTPGLLLDPHFDPEVPTHA